jgi:hypothetical protein
MQVRVCRDCGEEFRPDRVVCSDCGGALEDRDDSAREPAAAPEPTGARLSPARTDLIALVEGSTVGEIEPFAKRLGETAIPFAVSGAIHQFQLLVAPEDRTRARVALGLDAAPGDDAALTACPACASELAPGVGECPECGLALAAPPEPGE